MKRRVFAILAYTVLVAVVLLASTCEGSVKITSPERDVQRLEMMAATVRSEAELRDLERLATKYEIAYGKAMNGATALYFKALVEPILVEAGMRRDEVRAEEDYLAMVVADYRGALEDMERAWLMELVSAEQSLATIAEIKAKVDGIEAELLDIELRKEELAMEIIEQSYPENLLTELGQMEELFVAKGLEAQQLLHEIEVICLAHRLQRGEELQAEPAAVEELVEEPAEEFEVVTEPML
jgi:predicted HAD superfamily phosphohydrolase